MNDQKQGWISSRIQFFFSPPRPQLTSESFSLLFDGQLVYFYLALSGKTLKVVAHVHLGPTLNIYGLRCTAGYSLSAQSISRSNNYFFLALQPNAGYGLLVHEVIVITQNDVPHSVGLLWTSDQFIAETST
jgi:hypothetical protein